MIKFSLVVNWISCKTAHNQLA